MSPSIIPLSAFSRNDAENTRPSPTSIYDLLNNEVVTDCFLWQTCICDIPTAKALLEWFSSLPHTHTHTHTCKWPTGWPPHHISSHLALCCIVYGVPGLMLVHPIFWLTVEENWWWFWTRKTGKTPAFVVNCFFVCRPSPSFAIHQAEVVEVLFFSQHQDRICWDGWRQSFTRMGGVSTLQSCSLFRTVRATFQQGMLPILMKSSDLSHKNTHISQNILAIVLMENSFFFLENLPITCNSCKTAPPTLHLLQEHASSPSSSRATARCKVSPPMKPSGLQASSWACGWLVSATVNHL